MSAHLISLAAGALVLAWVSAAPDTAHPAADRHAGVYQFEPLPEGWCAGHAPQSYRPQAPARLTPLGALPPAYVIRLTATAPAPLEAAPPTAAPPPASQGPYDPCARVGPAVVRVR
ncbi:hypothetical protein ACO2Q3_02710 [Caulobacter sp. KR2-114]|uniref:hypothetical protein n=1 Tax=Caulobacter sp. KR2-114 TaxID=3400912 RepID=UPI003C0D78CA